MMRTLTLLLLLGAPRVAEAQLLGVYSDSAATSCNLVVPFPGASVDVYIVFTPGSVINGIRWAAFRVDGLPSGWTAETLANPAATSSIGSPFTYPGAEIAFPACQPGTTVLYRVRLTPTSPVTNQELVVRTHYYFPGGLSCPRVEPCPDPGFGTLSDALALLNSDVVCRPRRYGGCPTVDTLNPPPPTAWGRVKTVYRE